jgi:Luciferase
MMQAASVPHGDQTYADRALEQLRKWPALRVGETGCGVAIGVAAGPAEIVHLHQPDEARLCLTRPVIERLSGALDGNDQVQAEPDSDWIRVRLHSDGAVALLVSLVSVAIQAHSRHADAPVAAAGDRESRRCRPRTRRQPADR